MAVASGVFANTYVVHEVAPKARTNAKQKIESLIVLGFSIRL